MPRNLLPYLPKLTPKLKSDLVYLFWLNGLRDANDPWEATLPFWNHELALSLIDKEIARTLKDTWVSPQWLKEIKDLKELMETDPETINKSTE